MRQTKKRRTKPDITSYGTQNENNLTSWLETANKVNNDNSSNSKLQREIAEKW